MKNTGHLIVAPNVLNGNTVVVDDLNVNDRRFVLQLDLFGEHGWNFLRVALLGSADRDVQEEDEDLAAVCSGPQRRGDRLSWRKPGGQKSDLLF